MNVKKFIYYKLLKAFPDGMTYESLKMKTPKAYRKEIKPSLKYLIKKDIVIRTGYKYRIKNVWS